MSKTRLVKVWKHIQLPFQGNIYVEDNRFFSISFDKSNLACWRASPSIKTHDFFCVVGVNPSTHVPDPERPTLFGSAFKSSKFQYSMELRVKVSWISIKLGRRTAVFEAIVSNTGGDTSIISLKPSETLSTRNESFSPSSF